ncbi:MAG: sulfotransferase [Acidimicrobiales bacterium]
MDLTPVIVRLVSGRSGSSLLMQLLGTSDEVVLDLAQPYENRYLSYLQHLVRPMGQEHDPAGPWQMHQLIHRVPGVYGPMPFDPLSVDREELQRRSMQGLWSAFSSSARSKNPRARFYAEKIRGDFDLVVDAGIPARAIDLVRDPRDIFTSILEFDARRGFHGFGRQPGQSELEYVEVFAASVRARAAEMRRELPRTDVASVRYEELVRDLPGVAARLGAWLGTSFSAEAVEHQAAAHQAHMTSVDPVSSIGRWRSDLDPSLVARLEELLAEELVQLGYPSDGGATGRPRWLRRR